MGLVLGKEFGGPQIPLDLQIGVKHCWGRRFGESRGTLDLQTGAKRCRKGAGLQGGSQPGCKGRAKRKKKKKKDPQKEIKNKK